VHPVSAISVCVESSRGKVGGEEAAKVSEDVSTMVELLCFVVAAVPPFQAEEVLLRREGGT
jgi:hypothetical protein